MSHFLTIVLLPPDTEDPVSTARQRMLPYLDDETWETWEERPDFKCDGFVIGGLFDGKIWGKEQHYNLTPMQFQQRYGLDVVKPHDNIRPVSQIVPDLVPYAFVLPDGSWIDIKGIAKDGQQLWAKRIFQAHSDCLAVAIDCHC